MGSGICEQTKTSALELHDKNVVEIYDAVCDISHRSLWLGEYH